MTKKMVSLRLEEKTLEVIENLQIGLTEAVERGLELYLNGNRERLISAQKVSRAIENIPVRAYVKFRNPRNSLVFYRYLIYVASPDELILMHTDQSKIIDSLKGKKLKSLVQTVDIPLNAEMAVVFVENEKKLQEFITNSNIGHLAAVRSNENMVYAYQVE